MMSVHFDRLRSAVVLVLVLVLSACGDARSGPGILEVVGIGVVSVEGAPDGWTAAALPGGPAGEPATFRIVALTDDPGSLALELGVENSGARLPTVTVVEASDASDLPLTDLESLEVTVQRRR